MTTDTRRPPVPDLWLERLRLGELPPHQAHDLEDRLANDPALRARLDAIAHDDRTQRASGTPHLVAAGARHRMATRGAGSAASRWRTATVAAATASVVVAVAAVFLRSPLVTGPATGDEDGDRIKGPGAAIVAFRKTGSGSAPLRDGDIARERDVIRLGYQAAGRAFGVIVSVDGRGAVTQHLPAAGTAAAPLQPGGQVLLDTAYELDNAPRWERFCLVTSDRPFDVGEVLDAARTAARGGEARLTVPHRDVTCLTLRKE